MLRSVLGRKERNSSAHSFLRQPDRSSYGRASLSTIGADFLACQRQQQHVRRAGLQRNSKKNLLFSVNYTWSHEIDDGSTSPKHLSRIKGRDQRRRVDRNRSALHLPGMKTRKVGSQTQRAAALSYW
jgi:hypothetical protein